MNSVLLGPQVKGPATLNNGKVFGMLCASFWPHPGMMDKDSIQQVPSRSSQQESVARLPPLSCVSQLSDERTESQAVLKCKRILACRHTMAR